MLILIVGVSNKSLGLKSAWEGIRLVLFGLFSTGRDASGALTFGFNPTSIGNMLFRATPLILTGLSVATGVKARRSRPAFSTSALRDSISPVRAPRSSSR